MNATEAKAISLLYHAMMHWRAEASSDVVRRINEAGSGVNEAQEEIEAKGGRYQPKCVR